MVKECLLSPDRMKEVAALYAQLPIGPGILSHHDMYQKFAVAFVAEHARDGGSKIPTDGWLSDLEKLARESCGAPSTDMKEEIISALAQSLAFTARIAVRESKSFERARGDLEITLRGGIFAYTKAFYHATSSVSPIWMSIDRDAGLGMVKEFASYTHSERMGKVWQNLGTLSETPQVKGYEYDESCRKVAIAVAVDYATLEGNMPLDLENPAFVRWHTRMRENLRTTSPDSVPPTRASVEEMVLDFAKGLIPTVKHCVANSFNHVEAHRRFNGAWNKLVGRELTLPNGRIVWTS